MNIVPLMVFVSLMLVAASLLLFGHSMARKDHQHADRLALLPMTDSESPRAEAQEITSEKT
ncbi:MAG: cytochrome oxidase [Myxococcota bacterium]